MALRDILVHFGVTVDDSAVVSAQKNVAGLVHEFKKLASLAGLGFGAFGFVSFMEDSADSFTELSNSLKAVTKDSAGLESATEGVMQVARDTYEPVSEVAEAFRRFSFATDELGMSQEDTLDFTKRLTQAIKISGGSATETQAALRELSHGLVTNFEGSSRELRALQKNAPLLAQIVSKSLGGTAKDFVEFGKEGKITAKVFVDALRGAGAELDKQFGKRQPTFEELRNRRNVEWLELMKQLKPAIAFVTEKLIELLKWTQEWVKDGSAMNSFIAALIVGVGLLTAAFGPLAFEAALALAPIAGLFLLVDDFVTFMRGGDSVIGDFFEDHGGAENARKKIEEAWEILKKLGGFLADPNSANWQAFYEAALPWIDKLTGYIKTKIAEIRDEIANMWRDFIYGQKGTVLRDAVDARDAQKSESANDAQNRLTIGSGDSLQKLNDTLAGGASSAGGFVGHAALSTPGALWDSFSGVTQWAASLGDRAGNAVFGSAPSIPLNVGSRTADTTNGGAPVITNSIVVQGNADAATARDIATQTGAATAAALGRDRAAIGASAGLGY